MKKLLLVLFVFIACLELKSQGIEPISYVKIISVDSVDKEDIFFAVKEWIGTYYISAKSVIEMEDKDAGLIILNGVEKYSKKGMSYLSYAGYLKYSMKIQVRDGRLRIQLYNFIHKSRKSNVNLGHLTTLEKRDKSISIWSLKWDNEVWYDLKIKAAELSENFFFILSGIKFKKINDNSNEDW